MNRNDPLRSRHWRQLLVSLLAASATQCAVAAGDPRASRLYEDALSRFEKKDYAAAVIQLKNALQFDKNMLPVHVLLGKALMATGDVGASEVAFNDAIRLGVNRSEVIIPLARAMTDQGRQQEVIDDARFALSGLPASIQLQLLLVKAAAHSDLGDVRAAFKAIEEARVLDPRSPDVWLAEIPLRIRSRQFTEAQAAIDKALALDPKAANAHHAAAQVLHVLGRPGAAMTAYEKALSIQPEHVESLIAHAGLLIDAKRDGDASANVARIQELAPTDPRGWYLSALLAERQGNAQAMRDSLSQITALLDPVPIEFLRFRPQMLMINGQAHYGLGEREKAKPFFELFNRVQSGTPVAKLLANLYVAEGSHDRAIEALEQYLRAFPNDSQAQVLLASAHMAKGRHARAASLMQEALRKRDAPELYTTYGLSLLGAGQTANALTQLETAYKKDPGQTQAAFALIGLYLQARQTAKALTVASALATRQANNPSVRNLLGMAKAANRDSAGARNAFEQAIKLDPSLASARINLARLEAASKNPERAAALLEEVLKADERNTEAMVELALLAQRQGNDQASLRLLQKGADVGAGNDLRPGLNLVDLLMRKGRRDEALKAAQQLAKAAPESLPVLMALSRAQLAAGDAASARASLNAATRLAQFSAPAQVEVALLQLAAGNPQGAQYSVEKALNDRPEFLPALAIQNDLDVQRGDLPKAEQRAQAIVKREPRLPVGYSLLGDVAMARKQLPAAIDWYRKAHQVQPSQDTLTRLANTMTLQDPRSSTKLLEDWVKAHPSDLSARNLLAENRVRSGDMAGARREYEALRDKLPKNATVLNNLANVLMALKDPQALAVAEQAMAAEPGNVVMVDTAGWAAHLSAKPDRALQLLRDARLRDPENATVRYHLGAALAAAGRTSEARDELKAAVSSKSRFDGRANAETLLLTLK